MSNNGDLFAGALQDRSNTLEGFIQKNGAFKNSKHVLLAAGTHSDGVLDFRELLEDEELYEEVVNYIASYYMHLWENNERFKPCNTILTRNLPHLCDISYSVAKKLIELKKEFFPEGIPIISPIKYADSVDGFSKNLKESQINETSNVLIIQDSIVLGYKFIDLEDYVYCANAHYSGKSVLLNMYVDDRRRIIPDTEDNLVIADLNLMKVLKERINIKPALQCDCGDNRPIPMPYLLSY